MRRFSMISLMMLVCSVATYSQFWIDFRWSDSHCRDCEWMERSLRMTDRQAYDYHNIVHKYGQRIEKEARKDYKHWNKVYRKIYDIRMDRDRKIQHILSPRQFGLYIRLTREQPRYIHDYKGWYNNPNYVNVRIMSDWIHFENNYWTFRWDGRDYRNYRWEDWDRYDNNHYSRPVYPRSNNHNNDRYYQELPKKYQPSPGNNKNKDKNDNNGWGNKNNRGNSKDNKNSNSRSSGRK